MHDLKGWKEGRKEGRKERKKLKSVAITTHFIHIIYSLYLMISFMSFAGKKKRNTSGEEERKEGRNDH